MEFSSSAPRRHSSRHIYHGAGEQDGLGYSGRRKQIGVVRSHLESGERARLAWSLESGTTR